MLIILHTMSPENIQQFYTLIERSSRILLLAPKNIDGDTIGTNVALYLYLKSLGKNPILYSPVPLDEKFLWMPHINEFVFSFDPYEVDLIVTSDTAVPTLFLGTDNEKVLFSRGISWINLDHHISNSKYGTLNLLNYEATSCSMILHEIFAFKNVQITKDMATYMLMSIYMDSGSFIHPNTKPKTYEVASKLVECGAEVAKIGEVFFRSNELGKMRLWGLVFERMQRLDGDILISYLEETDFLLSGTTKEDVEGVVDMMNTVPNNVVVLLTEDGKGNVKGSLRTMSDDVDLNEIAKRFGGGGHKKAAGFYLRNTVMSNLLQFSLTK